MLRSPTTLFALLASIALSGCYGSEPLARSTRVAPEVEAALARGEPVSVIVAFDTGTGECIGQTASDDARGIQSTDAIPIAVMRIDSLAALDKILESSAVTRVELDAMLHIEEMQGLALVGQPAAHAAGLDGAGGTVAILDTGVDFRHPDLGGCAEPGAPGCPVVGAVDIAPDDGEADAHGHGTNVAAIVHAVAPAARILSLDVADGRDVATSTLLRAINWILAHRTEHDVVAINMSVGGGEYDAPCADTLIAKAIECLRSAGIVSVTSAGNDGATGALSSPACAPAAVSVGAVYASDVGGVSFPSCDDATTGVDQIACFTNVSPMLSMLAPGVLVEAGGRTMSGTSQASPYVAGAIAVAAGAFRAEGPDGWIDRLRRTGHDVRDERTGLTFPRLDLQAAVADAPRR